MILMFQRMYRWSERQAEELVVSLVQGMPIPLVYCYRNREEQMVILDGQQRILSLYLYYIGKFLKRKKNAFVDLKKLTDHEMGIRQGLEEYGLKDKIYTMKLVGREGNEREVDITYETLTAPQKRKIDFCPITLIQINVDSEQYRERTLHKIFANLNMGGSPLSSQEPRNGIYGCKFYDMLYDINDYCKKWRFLYSGNQNMDVNKESKDVELLLRMCAFRYYVTGSGADFLLNEYKGKISILLDDFSEKAKDFDLVQIEEYRQVLLSFIDSLEEVSGRNKGLALISLFVAWDRIGDQRFISKRKVTSIVESEEYRSTILHGTSGRNEIEKRLRCAYERLQIDD